MLQKLQKRNSSEPQGFTIIEVLIVLAIAGLIMLIVFLAVPALQRNARNTSRKSDVSAILSAVSEWSDNNQGTLPTTSGQFSTEFTNVNPNLGYYTTAANIQWKYQSAAATVADPADLDKVTVANYAKCNGNATATTGATSRSIVILYDVEGSGGKIVAQCQES